MRPTFKLRQGKGRTLLVAKLVPWAAIDGCPRKPWSRPFLEIHAVAAFEVENFPRFIWRCDLIAEFLDDPPDFCNLLSV